MFAFLLPLLSNITIPQIVAAIPQLIKIGQAGFSIYENLTSAQNLPHEVATAQAAGIVLKAIVKLVTDTVGAVLPHELRSSPIVLASSDRALIHHPVIHLLITVDDLVHQVLAETLLLQLLRSN